MKPGLYEQVLDADLEEALATFVGDLHARELDPADSHQVLGQHVARLIQAVLQRQPSKDRLAHQLRVCNRLMELLAQEDSGLNLDGNPPIFGSGQK